MMRTHVVGEGTDLAGGGEAAAAAHGTVGPPPVEADRAPSLAVLLLLLPLRLVGFAGFQVGVALFLLLQGRPDAWAASAAWWPLAAIVSGAGTLAVLVGLLRREGRRWSELFRTHRASLGRDLAGTAWVAVLAAVLVVVPNLVLATALFGNPTAPLHTFVRPLPGWAVGAALTLFPASVAATELAFYFGFLLPRIALRPVGPGPRCS